MLHNLSLTFQFTCLSPCPQYHPHLTAESRDWQWQNQETEGEDGELFTCHSICLPRFCKHWVASSLGKHQPCILLTYCATDFMWVLSVLLKIQSQREGSGGSHLSGATHPVTYNCWQGCFRGPHLSGTTHSDTYRSQAGHLREWVGLELRHRDTGLAHWNYMERAHITHPAKKCMLSHFSQAPDLALIFPQWIDSGMWHAGSGAAQKHQHSGKWWWPAWTSVGRRQQGRGLWPAGMAVSVLQRQLPLSPNLIWS